MPDTAKTYWQSLMQSFGNPVATDTTFQQLLASYAEAHRYYHNLQHILNMLEELESIRNQVQINNYEAIALAIWYHDIVYNTTPHAIGTEDNETQSAQRLITDNKKLGLDEALIKHACELILATKHTHAVTDADAQLLVDLDLAILGKPHTIFDAYESNIRQEYAWVPEPDFRAGRAKILQSFLDRSYIYATPYFGDKYESMARENLRRSIGVLIGE